MFSSAVLFLHCAVFCNVGNPVFSYNTFCVKTPWLFCEWSDPTLVCYQFTVYWLWYRKSDKLLNSVLAICAVLHCLWGVVFSFSFFCLHRVPNCDWNDCRRCLNPTARSRSISTMIPTCPKLCCVVQCLMHWCREFLNSCFPFLTIQLLHRSAFPRIFLCMSVLFLCFCYKKANYLSHLTVF